ncbi:hypothetical protein BJY52DRAFT_1187433 [Lactarius psammicola]|nr:hypothetical protein BJY52DRAFT_1187433 [Lactarius psammicola]
MRVLPHFPPNSTSQKLEDRGSTMTINFVVLQSPLLGPSSPGTVIVSQELSTNPSLPEILWNFSRYNDPARITLEKNPHFYLRCPADESAYKPTFQRHPLQDPSGALEHTDTVYVLFDRPGRVFLDTENTPRIFGNVWSLNGFLIFRDRSGVLEGEQLVRSSSTIWYNLWYREEPDVRQDSESRSRLNHSYLRPIVTTLSSDRSAEGILEDWTVLSRPASHSINIIIYGSGRSPGYTRIPDLAPSPPTSERPGYDVLYTIVNTLNDDMLLCIFNYYRLDDNNAWNVRLGWCKLSQVCRRWRHLIYSSASHLGMHIRCTNSTPIVGMLDHLPPLPLFVDYRVTTATLSAKDKLGIHHALLLCDRVRGIDLHLPPSILHKFLMLMDKPFSMLGHLSLSSITKEDTSLVLPRTFLAPNLRHLTLLGVGLPNRLRFLSSVSLVTLALTNIRASSYILPRQLVTRLRSLPQLEELTIGFSIPIPRPSTERELLGKRGTPVTLPNLKLFRFRGVSAYLERLVAQIRAPLLERLDITLFNQIAFVLPHLSHLVNTTEAFKLPTATVSFGNEVSIIITGHQHGGHFALRVICKELDWQIDCAAQICSALLPALSGVQELGLNFDGPMTPTKWDNGEIDGTTWHELLRSFIGVNELRVCGALSQELSRALQVDEVGLDPELLPGLQEIQFYGKKADNLFSSFIHARRVAGRPVRSTLSYTMEGDVWSDRAEALDTSSKEIGRRLAGHYLNNPDVDVSMICLELGRSGQHKVTITLDMTTTNASEATSKSK